MKPKRGFKRSERVSQQLHELLARTLLTDVSDPRVADVQITHVDLTPNLRHARIFYVLFEGRGFDQEVQAALERVLGVLKREVGAQLNLKYVPDIVFEYDESIERGRRIEDLLSGLDDN
ncbi:MAG: 30S ribosome-binding factor RbfA [Bradymonadaceae bacterium]|nr:30S ribosome-binding factor RbfA [Lujinxingiaceae bacterium]